jgi:MAF protein
MIQLILASGSPRRRELIRLLNYPCRVIVSNVDEEAIIAVNPAAYVLETARQKAAAVTHTLTTDNTSSPADQRTVIIAADTTVALDGEILGKPANAAEGRRMLRRLRGRDHVVHTGLVVTEPARGTTIAEVDSATVTMRSYSDEEIEAYLASGHPFDKAGAYGIQHPLFRPVATLQGCYLTVVGLSICHLVGLLQRLDIPPRLDTAALLATHDNHDCPLLKQWLSVSYSYH